MKQNPIGNKGLFACVVIICLIAAQSLSFAEEIRTEQVDWRGPAGGRIQKVRYRIKDEVPVEEKSVTLETTSDSIAINVIDSPPLDGFVPWIAITTTDRQNDDDEIWTAKVEPAVVGNFTSNNPNADFAIGVFDSGASAHVIGYEMSQYLALEGDFLTSNPTLVKGVTGEVYAWVSEAIGVFAGGLQILNTSGPEPLLIDTVPMRGESNVAVIVGDWPGDFPDLVTAIGTPLSVYYTTVIQNSQPVSVTYKGTDYTGPQVGIYGHEDPNIPTYPIKVPLELRPLGASGVEYVPTIDFGSLEYEPFSPSIIIGVGSQNMFFVHSVDLEDGSYSAIDKDRFMLDTGAQISVIGSRIAARLNLDPEEWEFQVEIIGVTGESIDAPGFYLDSVKIPALGEWLEYTNVPVVLLDILSPEGGSLDGIIGMNLFVEYNLVLRGGGMALEDDPVLEVQRLTPLVGDIAPDPRDGQVNLIDYEVFSSAWGSSTGGLNWNEDADFVPSGLIDMADLSVLAGQWLANIFE